MCMETGGLAHGMFLLNSNAMGEQLHPVCSIIYLASYVLFIRLCAPASSWAYHPDTWRDSGYVLLSGA